MIFKFGNFFLRTADWLNVWVIKRSGFHNLMFLRILEGADKRTSKWKFSKTLLRKKQTPTSLLKILTLIKILNLELNNFIKQVESIDNKRQYQMTGMLVKFFKPKQKPDIHEIGQVNEKKKDYSVGFDTIKGDVKYTFL